MVLGIIPNTTKENIFEVIRDFTSKLENNGIEYLISDAVHKIGIPLLRDFEPSLFQNIPDLCSRSDFIVSIGGDGTMLNTAYQVREFSVPIIGLNIGKLGFLAEFDLQGMDELIRDLKNGKYFIEERMTLEGYSSKLGGGKLFALNDIVIDKGKWPKMIEITIKVDDDYVSTFSADGIIVATPTGSTGYSLSTGGPIVNPRADAITVSPISPHTLTMRPLVLSSSSKITLLIRSLADSIQINCDGQRAFGGGTPLSIEVCRSSKCVKLLHTHKTNYFEVLRNKLFWGLDVRNTSN